MSSLPRSLAATLALAFSLLAPSLVIAQDASPAAGEVVDPAECQIEARSIEDIEELQAGATSATPAPTDIGGLEGEPADEATVQAVTETYRQVVACLNAGDYLSVYAFYTDDYVVRTLGSEGLNVEQLESTPAADQSGTTALVSVTNVRSLDDGRVAARVETSDESTTGTVVLDAILVQTDDRYLIDAEVAVDASQLGTPAAGTPADAAAAGGGGAVEVVSYDIYFEPTEISIPADTDVTVSLPNEGVTLHNFAVDELGIDVDIEPGATEEVVVNAPAGTYEFYCNVPGHKAAGMVGTMTVG